MLARTKGWVRFIGVLSFIGAAFVALGMLAMVAFASKAGAVMLPIVVLYGAMVAFYIYAGLKLNGYASAITRLIYSGRVADLEDALDQQRAFWKFAGIMMLLFIILMFLAMAGGAFTAMQSAPFRNM